MEVHCDLGFVLINNRISEWRRQFWYSLTVLYELMYWSTWILGYPVFSIHQKIRIVYYVWVFFISNEWLIVAVYDSMKVNLSVFKLLLYVGFCVVLFNLYGWVGRCRYFDLWLLSNLNFKVTAFWFTLLFGVTCVQSWIKCCACDFLIHWHKVMNIEVFNLDK